MCVWRGGGKCCFRNLTIMDYSAVIGVWFSRGLDMDGELKTLEG